MSGRPKHSWKVILKWAYRKIYGNIWTKDGLVWKRVHWQALVKNSGVP
jgi:hypothetical protein